jgi:hypothetical protein
MLCRSVFTYQVLLTTVCAPSFITIIAVKSYVKFFHFKIPDSFSNKFETLSPTEREKDSSSFLFVDSTLGWFNIGTRKGREEIVRHLLALVAWANHMHERDMETGDEMDDDDEIIRDGRRRDGRALRQ